MNRTLHAMTALADAAQAEDNPSTRVDWRVIAGNGVVLTGHYDVAVPRDRTAFGQAAGKLLAAGYTIQTTRSPV